MRHVLDVFDLTPDEIEKVFEFSRELKERQLRGIRESLLPGRVVALLFEKPSLRTRVSFETAIAHLGGTSMFLGKDVGWGHRESTADFAQVLSQYVDVIVCRANAHRQVEDLAQFSSCTVVNGLTDRAHPCQALADLFTIQERHGKLAGLKLAFLGDANNVSRSLAVAAAKTGMEFAIASPPAYRFDKAFLAQLHAAVPNVRLTVTDDPLAAARGAAAVYTDVWASMGQESEHAERVKAFAPFQVNARVMKQLAQDAIFLHCLPARRGEEVTSDVIDGPQSAVIQQAANRMHVQKGLLAWLLGAAVG
ncbi:MAG: ornithine carbamoyltransferase [Pirellulaceae bacterium]